MDTQAHDKLIFEDARNLAGKGFMEVRRPDMIDNSTDVLLFLPGAGGNLSTLRWLPCRLQRIPLVSFPLRLGSPLSQSPFSRGFRYGHGG